MTRLLARASAFVCASALLLAACGGSGAAHKSNGNSTSRSTTTAAATTTEATTTSTAPSTTMLATTTLAPTTMAAVDPVAECLARIPVRTKVAQLVMPAVYGPQLDQSAAAFAQLGLGGAALMTAPTDLHGDALLRFKRAGKIPLLIATDEEGGVVQRLKGLGILPSEEDMVKQATPQQAEARIAQHAIAVKKLGVDVAWAPVVDVDPVGGEGPLGNRLFSDNPSTVAAYGAAYVTGWESAGILPVLKHFPGHGSASGDTHVGGAVTPDFAQMQARDLVPYVRLVNSGAGVMVGHLVTPGLNQTGPYQPASVSRHVITDLLRNQLGYRNALVFSDSLDMGAISSNWTVPQAAEESIKAGADIAVFKPFVSAGPVIDRLVDAVQQGRIPIAQIDASLTRVLAAKHLAPCSIA